MELYRKYPKLCTAWCYMECSIFFGVVYGWGVLMSILKDEGFYGNGCPRSHGDQSNDSLGHVSVSDNMTTDPSSYSMIYEGSLNDAGGGENVSFSQTTEETFQLGVRRHSKCRQQDSSLNLLYSIGVTICYVSCAFLGPMMRKLGMRYFRLFYTMVYMIGTMCLGFATSVTPWLVGPGVACVATAGLGLYSSSVQMSFLFPRWQSSVMSLFTGLFDVSSFTVQLVKVAYVTAGLLLQVAYEHGVPRKHSYLFLTGVCGFTFLTSTLFMLPKDTIVTANSRPGLSRDTIVTASSSPGLPKTECQVSTDKADNSTPFLPTEPPIGLKTPSKGSTASVMAHVFSAPYLLHILWMSAAALRFNTFISFLNPWLESIFSDDKQRGDFFLSMFSYITNGTTVAGLTAGLLHDQQRRKYQGKAEFIRKRQPMVLPLSVTTLLAVSTTTLTFFPQEPVLYAIFILFTFLRSYAYSYQITYLNDTFPLEVFPVLLGLLQFVSGMTGMLQYPLFLWYEAYPGASVHVTTFLLLLGLTSFVHPLLIWWRCRRHEHDRALELEVFVHEGGQQ